MASSNMALLSLSPKTEEALRHLIEGGLEKAGLSVIAEAATSLLAGLETEFSELYFVQNLSKRLEATDIAAGYVVATEVVKLGRTPRDGASYRSAVALRGRWIVDVPAELVVNPTYPPVRAFQLPNGILLWASFYSGDAYDLGSGSFRYLQWGVPSRAESWKMPTVLTVEDLGQQILTAARAVRALCDAGLVALPCMGDFLPKEYAVRRFLGTSFVQGPLRWVRCSESERPGRAGDILRTPDGRWWDGSRDEAGTSRPMNQDEKRRTRRQINAGGTVRNFVERTKSYPARARLAGFPNLFIEEGRGCEGEVGFRPFHIVTSFPNDGYGVIRRLMERRPLDVIPPRLPNSSSFLEETIARFCAEHRIVPVSRTQQGDGLRLRELVVLFREDGGAELLGQFSKSAWPFLRYLMKAAKRFGRRLTEDELRELAREFQQGYLTRQQARPAE